MSKKIEDLENRVAILENQRDRAISRLQRVQMKCYRVVDHSRTPRNVRALMIAVVFNLGQVEAEYNRYYIEPKE